MSSQRRIPKKPINPKTGRYDGEIIRTPTKPPAAPTGRTTQTSARAAAAAIEANKPKKKMVYRNLPEGYWDEREESIERAKRIDAAQLERARQQLKKKETETQRAEAKAKIEKVLLAAVLKRRATIARKKLEAEKKAQLEQERQAQLERERQRHDEDDGVRLDDYDNISSKDIAQLEAEQESFLAAHPLIKQLTWCSRHQMKTPNIESKIKESKVRKNQGHERGKCYFLSSRCAQCCSRKSSFLSDKQTGGGV